VPPRPPRSSDDGTPVPVKAATPTTAEGQAPKRGAGPSNRPAAALIGMTLSGRYLINRLIGEGGMGAVYEAEHTHMKKRLAVKVLHAEMSRLQEVVDRFEREAMAAAHIEHPNVAAATDFGKLEDGSCFLVLEYVEGQSLREAIGKGRLELGRALRVTFQIASALQRAHALGIVHRDLKPENVMLVEREGDPDFVKVLDFGIAKVPVGDIGTSVKPSADAPVLTQMGMVYGTPEYMAPEQALGQVVDARADLYALGVMLYEMLAGSRPFDHESKVSLLGMHVTARVPPFAERSPEALVPPEVEAIVMRLMSKEATDRFDGAKELSDAIVAVMTMLIERQRIEPLGSAAIASTSSPNFPSMIGAMSARSPQSAALAPTSLAAPSGRAPLSSAALHSESGAMRLASPQSRSGKYAAIVATILGGMSVLAVVAIAMAGRGKKGQISPLEGGALTTTTTNESDDPADDARIAAALASIDKGDYAEGIATLTALEPKDMDRADMHRALVKADLATGAAREAMLEAALLVKADPTASADQKLLEDIRNVALEKGDASDAAFSLIQTSMGSVGVDMLYDIAYATWAHDYPAASTRARKALGMSDVRSKGSAAVQIALDLRSASTCGKQHDLLARAGDVGDYRALAILKAYLPTRGCGFLGARDCWPCMRKDNALPVAIKVIEDRKK
jgi:serine/threonine protein kinase